MGVLKGASESLEQLPFLSPQLMSEQLLPLTCLASEPPHTLPWALLGQAESRGLRGHS